MTRKFLKWLPSVVVMTLIFITSSVDGTTINSSGLGSNTLHINGHFLMFFFLCISLYYATRDLKLSFIFTMIYALFDEYHQSFVPLRSASLFDIFVDGVGALLGLISCRIYLQFRKKTVKTNS